MPTNPYHHFIDDHNHQQIALLNANKHSSSSYNINNACSNKLLTHKSSFQVWKCVSFGCSLIAIALILSKWHEVSTDLYLLIGIERVMTSSSSMMKANETSLSWPPVPLDQLLPAPNETSFGIESMENNETMLMSHLHMSLNREHNGDNLLRQEVDAFLGEFQKAKSTLGLSSLLIIIYIMSWIFMTLAINDTRISNDISLRNILLLSVYGAIDMAASVGFVMIRLVMFNFKNNLFVSQILDSNGLRDAQIRLTSDQLTAFTALRLIAMRSNSAYIDVYVTTLFCFLAILRLIGVLKGITYYKYLRQLTNKSHDQKQQHQHSDIEQQQTTKDHNWPNFFAGPGEFLSSHHLTSSPSSRPPASMPENTMHDISSHPAGYRTINKQPINEFRGLNNQSQYYQQETQSNQLTGKPMSLSPAITDIFREQQGGSLPTGNRLIFNNSSSLLDKAQMMVELPQYHSSTMKVSSKQANRGNAQLLILPEKHQQSATRIKLRSKTRSRQHDYNNNNSSGNIFMVNGRTHRVTTNANGDSNRHSEPLSHIQVKRDELDINNNEEDLQQHEQQQINKSLPAGLSFRKLNADDFEGPENSGNDIFGNSEQNLLDQVIQATKATTSKRPKSDALFNTVRSNGTTYTLLSAAQLNKLSKKLAKSDGRNTINHTQQNNSKYRLIDSTARHTTNQAPSTSSGKRDSGLIHDLSTSTSTSSLSSSSSQPLSDTNSTSCGPEIESDTSLPTNSKLERKHARRLGICQTEEQLVAANSIKTAPNKHNTQAKLSSASQEIGFLSGKSSEIRCSTRISSENHGSPTLSLQMSEIQAWSMASDEEDEESIINPSSNHQSEPSGTLLHKQPFARKTTSRGRGRLFKSNSSPTFGCRTLSTRS